MVFSAYFYVEFSDEHRDFISELPISQNDTFESIFRNNLNNYQTNVVKVYSLNTTQEFNLNDVIMNSVQPCDNIVYVFKSDKEEK